MVKKKIVFKDDLPFERNGGAGDLTCKNKFNY